MNTRGRVGKELWEGGLSDHSQRVGTRENWGSRKEGMCSRQLTTHTHTHTHARAMYVYMCVW